MAKTLNYSRSIELLLDLAELTLGVILVILSGIGIWLLILSRPTLMGNLLETGGATFSPVMLRGGGDFKRSVEQPPF